MNNINIQDNNLYKNIDLDLSNLSEEINENNETNIAAGGDEQENKITNEIPITNVEDELDLLNVADINLDNIHESELLKAEETETNTIDGGGSEEDQLANIEINNNPLIDKEKIKKQVRKYIDNYNSQEYNDYKNGFYTKELYSKVNKNNHIVYKNGYVYLVKTSQKQEKETKKKTNDKNEHIMKVKMPKYKYIKDEIKTLNSNLKSTKEKLDKLYIQLKTKTKHTNDEITEFNKLKKLYTTTLEDIETINIYNTVINDIKLDGTKSIQHINLTSNLNSNYEYIEKKSYNIPVNIIDSINSIQHEKLNEYNRLMKMLKNDPSDKNIKSNIKEYLQKYHVGNTENSELNKEINKKISKQDKYIDYIVTDLPQKF